MRLCEHRNSLCFLKDPGRGFNVVEGFVLCWISKKATIENSTKYNFVKSYNKVKKSLSAGTTKYAEHQLVTEKLKLKRG